MAAYETHVQREMMGITSPPFRFPSRTPESRDAFYKENLTTLKTANAEAKPLPNATTVFDWVKAPGADADNILLMSNEDAGYKAPPDYTLYIILGSILFVLIVLTVVTIMLYKAYRSRDQYSLAAGNRVKVFRAFDETGGAQEDKLDYEIVDFDKNSYRF